jgi:branched-chain amino acid transport system permease protein
VAVETKVVTTPAGEEELVVEKPAPFRPTPGGWAARGVVLAALAWLVLLYPGNLLSPFHVEAFEASAFSLAVIYAIIGLSLNILIGYTGQISLGHQAFVGIGAFTSAYMVSEAGQEFWIAVLVAAGVGGLQALVLGGVALRVTGLYFALITLSYGVLAEDSLFNIQSLTGGGAGQLAPKPTGFESDYRYYYLCLGFLALALWVDWRMMRTKGGRALLALRENPRVAATMGINVRLFTLFAFVMAGIWAGVGGALLAHRNLQVVSVSFNFQLALLFIIMTVVGGLRSRVGVVIGSAFFALLPEILKLLDEVPLLRLEHRLVEQVDLPVEFIPLVIGPILLLLTLTLYPGGIGQQIRPLQKWLTGGRFDIHDRGEKDVQVTDVRA